jgi:serine/threonine protein kinase
METDTKSVPNSNYVYYIRKIGKGSFSKVYKGYNIITGDIVAVKKIDLDMKPLMIKRLKMEIEIMKTLKHKHIVELYDVIYDEYYAYLIMEYSHCGDLANYLKGRPLKEKFAQKFSRQLSSAMKYLIERNIIHRDIKPQNILVFNKNTIKLTDFGFARYFDKTTMVETLCGSPLYMSPEIIKYKKYSHKADLWSIGVIIYEILTGRPPYRAKTHYELAKKIENSEVFLPKMIPLSKSCKDLIFKLLQKESINRISWEEFFNHNWIKDPDTKPEIYKNIIKSDTSPGILSVKSSQSSNSDLAFPLQSDEQITDSLLSNSFCSPDSFDNLPENDNDSYVRDCDDIKNTVLIKTTPEYINLKNRLKTNYISSCEPVNNEMFSNPVNFSPPTRENSFIIVKKAHVIDPIQKQRSSNKDPNSRTIFSGLYSYMNCSVNYVKTYLKNIPNSN